LLLLTNFCISPGREAAMAPVIAGERPNLLARELTSPPEIAEVAKFPEARLFSS
jgi:hypothetical protein